ncbi:MAG: hypothetical protein IJF44_05275 [Clostridia bacterium]|nr:hypothetical protein [Clostridia bacterium]
MKKFLGLLLTGILLFCTIFSIVGCGEEMGNEEKEIFGNAVLYDNAQTYAKEEFLEENITNLMAGGENAPEEIVYIVKEQTDFDAMFTDFPTAIDFETEMVIVYLFTDINAGFGCSLSEVRKEKKCLHITFLHHMPEPDKNGCIPPMGSAPTQRCLLVKIDKCDIELAYINWCKNK